MSFGSAFNEGLISNIHESRFTIKSSCANMCIYMYVYIYIYISLGKGNRVLETRIRILSSRTRQFHSQSNSQYE